MGINLRHVIWASLVLALGSFVYVVAFAPMDPSVNPRAGAIGREPTRAGLIVQVRRLMAQGQQQSALRMANVLIGYNPEDPEAYFYRAIVERGLGDAESSQTDFVVVHSLMEGLVSWPERFSGERLDYFRAWGLYGIGEVDKAQALFGQIADQLEHRSTSDDEPISDSGVLYNLACYRAMSGQHEVAIDWWDRAIAHGYGHDGGWWAVDPDLESLHDDDRFWEVSGQIRERSRDSVSKDDGASP